MKLLTLTIISIVLLLLKIVGLIHLSILWCLSPLWLPVALFLAFAVVILPLAAIAFMTLVCLVMMITVPIVVVKGLVAAYRSERHKHDYHSKPLGLDQCDDKDCGSIRETR